MVKQDKRPKAGLGLARVGHQFKTETGLAASIKPQRDT
jgi:hypothetical protein